MSFVRSAGSLLTVLFIIVALFTGYLLLYYPVPTAIDNLSQWLTTRSPMELFFDGSTQAMLLALFIPAILIYLILLINGSNKSRRFL